MRINAALRAFVLAPRMMTFVKDVPRPLFHRKVTRYACLPAFFLLHCIFFGFPGFLFWAFTREDGVPEPFGEAVAAAGADGGTADGFAAAGGAVAGAVVESGADDGCSGPAAKPS